MAERFVGDTPATLTSNVQFSSGSDSSSRDENRLQVTPLHFAYLKISEGCDRLVRFAPFLKCEVSMRANRWLVTCREAHGWQIMVSGS